MALGDELAEEIYNRIFLHKLNIVGNKIKNYFIAFNNVDIPEFLKPEHQQINNIVRQHLKRIVYQGRLEHFYNLAIQEESEV